ncbi:unnamed protein product [Tuber aestivum]|uniref:Uncharacterized protein n=1 Tax=Tuber aestivum TaxID=59557 RepID=A0A292PIT5_9PEZI|nr:unnamed protein product [Tuber aestivum]
MDMMPAVLFCATHSFIIPVKRSLRWSSQVLEPNWGYTEDLFGTYDEDVSEHRLSSLVQYVSPLVQPSVDNTGIMTLLSKDMIVYDMSIVPGGSGLTKLTEGITPPASHDGARLYVR